MAQKDPRELQIVTDPGTPIVTQGPTQAETGVESDPQPQELGPQDAAPDNRFAGSQDDPDRILSLEETEQLLMGAPRTDDKPDSEQQALINEFFSLPQRQEAPPETPDPQKPVQPQPQPQEPQPVPAPITPQPPIAAQPPQPAQAPVSPVEQALAARVQMLEQELVNLRTQATPTPGQQGQPQTQAPAPTQPEVPPYQFQIPQQIMQGLRSEDETVVNMALGSLLSGVAQSVHQNLAQEIEAVRGQIPTVTSQHVNEAQERHRVEQDFYGTYPELNAPHLRALVLPVAQQVAQETGAVSWNSQLRDEIARRLAPLSPELSQRLTGQAAALAPAQAAPQAPHQAHAQASLPRPNVTQTPGSPQMPAQQPAAPLLVRDSQGNLVQYVPATQLPPGTRPSNGSPVSEELQDIWRTLDYPF